MRFPFQQFFITGLVAATVSSGAAQALPPVVIPVQAEPTPEVVATSVNQSNSVQQTIFAISNQAREQVGLSKLSSSAELNAAAQRHADDLANGAKYSHTGSDGSSMRDRVKDSGYQYWSIAENIHYYPGRNRPAWIVQSWLKSAAHRQNMLNASFTDIGIGYATNGDTHYYVQVFGAPQ